MAQALGPGAAPRSRGSGTICTIGSYQICIVLLIDYRPTCLTLEPLVRVIVPQLECLQAELGHSPTHVCSRCPVWTVAPLQAKRTQQSPHTSQLPSQAVSFYQKLPWQSLPSSLSTNELPSCLIGHTHNAFVVLAQCCLQCMQTPRCVCVRVATCVGRLNTPIDR